MRVRVWYEVPTSQKFLPRCWQCDDALADRADWTGSESTACARGNGPSRYPGKDGSDGNHAEELMDLMSFLVRLLRTMIKLCGLSQPTRHKFGVVH
jgi:hypothetical protein